MQLFVDLSIRLNSDCHAAASKISEDQNDGGTLLAL